MGLRQTTRKTFNHSILNMDHILCIFYSKHFSYMQKSRERKMRLQNEWDGPRQIFYIDLVFFLTEKLVKIDHTTLKLGQEGYKRVVAYSISHSEVPTNQSQSWKKIENAPKKPKVRRLSNLYIWTYEGHERDRRRLPCECECVCVYEWKWQLDCLNNMFFLRCCWNPVTVQSM